METQSALTIPAKDNDGASSAIQDQLFIEQLCELDASLGNLSHPDFFEQFSLLLLTRLHSEVSHTTALNFHTIRITGPCYQIQFAFLCWVKFWFYVAHTGP